ncbi:MAG: hypothetical protein LBG47_08250 [Prevotellaceae bacterium]|jgi:hypothetical protein|nr:hypothetical protein [Prevotellaceae bacterium]
MFNYYLYHRSYENSAAQEIERNLQDLNEIVFCERRENEHFFKHDETIWGVKTADGIFGEVVFSKIADKQFSNSVIPKLFNAIDAIEKEILSFDDFDNLYKTYNAFYGINFANLNLDTQRCLRSKEAYKTFRAKFLWELTPASLWERREQLFSKIILCPSVEEQIKTIGASYIAQIASTLRKLDEYAVQYWEKGSFSYDDANKKAALNISPESETTMSQNKYRNQRVFSMPDGRKECFELHIKVRDIRFHIFPEGGKIYIGYIGKHLNTAKF